MEQNFSLEIKPEATEQEREIVEKYWMYGDDGFVTKPTVLAEENELSIYKLNQLVRNNSSCRISLGYCEECGDEIICEATSQSHFKSCLRDHNSFCESCLQKQREQRELEWQMQQEQRRLEREIQLKSIEERFQCAVHNRLWEQLSKEELLVLEKIVIFEDRHLIFKEVFDGDYHNTWNIVNKLEKLGLIAVVREDSCVSDFKFPQELKTEFLNSEYSLQKEKVVSVVSSRLSFSLPSKITRRSANTPNYGGKFILSNDVILKKGVEYVSGAWIQTDGSINIRFIPIMN